MEESRRSAFTQVASEHDWRLLIGGDLVESADRGRMAVIDPTTEEEVTTVPRASMTDVDRAVRGAEEASHDWGRVPVRERGATVRAMAEILAERADELALLDAGDGGFTVNAMSADVERAIEMVAIFADAGLELKGETIPVTTDHLHYTTLEPYGVVGRIIPFNHPIFFATTKIAAPLVAGNSVVLKCPDQTPLSGLRLAELLGGLFPPGVLNVLTGTGAEAGDALVRHPSVRRLAFIGSPETGRQIQRAAAAVAVKHVTLELGGKNAMIVFPDSDPELAATAAVAGMNFAASQGQSCGSTSRLLIHVDLLAEVVERVGAAVSALRVGDPLSAGTDVGPMVSRDQYEKSMRYIEQGSAMGARLVVGGGRPDSVDDRGFFVAPTVFDQVDASAPIAREEIFGPVLSVLSFRDEAEAIAIANDVEYGLTGAVFTEDLRRAHRVARDLDAGYVWINETSRHYWGTPFGGVKGSGVGREEHLDELRSFTQTKTVHVPFS